MNRLQTMIHRWVVGFRPRREKIEAFGDIKSAGEWAEDVRCTVTANTILDRVKRGMSPEDAISRPGVSWAQKQKRAPRRGPVEAFGETKTVNAWAADPRCSVSNWTLRYRLNMGMAPEQAITLGARPRGKAPGGRTIEAFGETKTVLEWVSDPRCVVRATTLKARLDDFHWEPERSLTTPPLHAPVRAKYVEAFGERKRIGEWARDPRCLITADLLSARLLSGMRAEEAITTVPLRGPSRRAWRPNLLITAFGETKGTAAWAEDPRCRVSQFTVWQRIVRGMDPEQAITTPARKGIYRLGADGKIEYVSPLITAWGETKTAAEWACDPRCKVSRAALLYRHAKGVPGEEAMTAPNPKAPLPPVTAFGETKTGPQWQADPRMKVDYKTFCIRIRKGVAPERAMTAPQVSKRMHWLTAWGETKPLAEWARDPRCSVAGSVLWKRMRAWECEPELLISAPARYLLKFDHARLLEGFGETKSLADWLDDKRRVLSRHTVTRRLHLGWELGDAMTTPLGGHKLTGRPAYRLLEAFGERKSASEWASDARCLVCKGTLESRLQKGWDIERAISSPRSPPDHTKGKRRRDSRALFITAFGETKTAMDWTDDARCSISGGTLWRRIRNGWTPEDAVSLPKTKGGGVSHTGVYTRPKNSPLVTAWGETKGLAEWGRDPRAKANNDQIGRRIKKGWDPEDAISSPPLPHGVNRDGTHKATVPARKFEAFGESKSLPEWSSDPRCAIRLHNLYSRLYAGWSLEKAITTPSDTTNRPEGTPLGRPFPSRAVVAWGETRTLQEWLKDPRANVSAGTALQRLERGWPAEDALSRAPDRGTQLDGTRMGRAFPSKVVTAWGETKTLAEWLKDPRTKAAPTTVYARLKAGSSPEDALSRPSDRYGYKEGKLTQRGTTFTAWGESKTLAEWLQDPRMNVSSATLYGRLRSGWPLEAALSRPPDSHKKLDGTPMGKPFPSKELTAWGETKTLSEWLKDPRTKAAPATVYSRLKSGASPEDALSRPPDRRTRLDGTPVGRSHPSKELTAWGETKTLSEWLKDPRTKAVRYTILARLARGWPPERALCTPTSRQAGR